jgi:thiol-disulfide isomerase/thioredoxin
MKVKIVIILLITPILFSFAQEEKKVLVEVFTNSHCPLCPPAHNVIEDYTADNPNKDKISVVFYHMVYPYDDDPLYHHNSIDSDGRDDFYNPIASTPRGFFNGQTQGSTSDWASTLDNIVLLESPLKISLSGTKMANSLSVKATVTRTGNIPDNDLAIHFVVVENLEYTGRNGISHHKNVMRDMIPGAQGNPFSIDIGDTLEVEREITLNQDWIEDSLKVVVFIQSSANKTVYQSAVINYEELNEPTDVDTETKQPEQFKLHQNYPNPFNPSTTISYSISEEENVVLKVYNILGKEIKTLVNKIQTAGNYEISLNADDLAGGIYFYRIEAGKYIQTRKMILLK